MIRLFTVQRNKWQLRRVWLMVQIFAVFVGVSILLAVTYGVFSYRAVYTELEKQLFDTNLNLLALTDTTTDVLFEDIKKSIIAASQNNDILSAVISPGLQRTQRNYDVVRYLSNASTSDTLISRALLYVDYDQTIFSSDGVATKVALSGDQALVNWYHTNTSSSGIQSKVTTFRYEDRIFCCLDFPLNGNYRNGTLIYEINQYSFYEKLNKQTKYNVYIFDEANRLLFENALDSTSLDLTEESLADLRVKGSGAYKRGLTSEYGVIYHYTSPGGWLYVYPVPFETLDAILHTVVTTILPLFILSLAVAILFASYLSRAIYRPIRRLTDLVSADRPNWEPSTKLLNELEFLGMAYRDAVNSNARLAGLLSRSSDAVLEKLLLALLQGRSQEPKDLEETLRMLDTPFSTDATYTAVAFHVSTHVGGNISILQTDLYKASLDSLVESACDKGYHHFPVTIDAGRIGMVLCFAPGESVEHVNQQLRTLLDVLQRESENLPCVLRAGVGKTYHSIYDLKFSYQEAAEKLNYQTYLNERLSVQEVLEANSAQDAFYDARFEQLAQALFTAQPDAVALGSRVLDELFGQTGELPILRERLKALLHALLELTGGHAVEGVSALEDPEEAMQTFDNIFTATELRQWADQVVHSASLYFGACNSRKKYHYVQRAKEYIKEHYAEPTLLLNEVAQSINITPTYLSRLFKEYQQSNFVDYLNSLRIHRAEFYLASTDLVINEIGFKCGFSSAQSFNRVFKRYKQITPGQYREGLQHQ